MKSLSIPVNFSFHLFNAKEKRVIQIKNQRSSFWFVLDPQDVFVKNRTVTASPQIIRTIKKILKNLEIGHVRTLSLLGIGYKAFYVEENGLRFLDIKTSSIQPARFPIPNDVSLKIVKQNVLCWSHHPTVIDHFYRSILSKIKFTQWH